MDQNNQKKINILSNIYKSSTEDIQKYYNINEYKYILVNNIVYIYTDIGGSLLLNKDKFIITIKCMNKHDNILKHYNNNYFSYLFTYIYNIYFYKKYYKNIKNNTKYYYYKYNNKNIYLYNITKYKYKNNIYNKYNIYNINVILNIKSKKYIYLNNIIHIIFYFCYIIY